MCVWYLRKVSKWRIKKKEKKHGRKRCRCWWRWNWTQCKRYYTELCWSEEKKTITFKTINQDVIPFDHLFGLFFCTRVFCFLLSCSPVFSVWCPFNSFEMNCINELSECVREREFCLKIKNRNEKINYSSSTIFCCCCCWCCCIKPIVDHDVCVCIDAEQKSVRSMVNILVVVADVVYTCFYFIVIDVAV